jgi:DNA-binding MarR family transcriptional regulator
MAERLPERFTRKNLPLLIEMARVLEDERRSPDPREFAEALGLDSQEALNLGEELSRTGYIDARVLPGDDRILSVHVLALTERGLRTVGLWPSDNAHEQLLAAIREAEGATADEADKSKLRKVAEVLGSMTQSVATDVAAAFARQMAGF